MWRLYLFARRIIDKVLGLGELRRLLGEANSGISAALSDIVHIKQEIEEFKLGLTSLEPVRWQALARGVPRALDEVAARLLTSAKALESPRSADEMRGLALHYARSAGLVANFWTARYDWPANPYPEDDGSLEFAKRCGVFAPGADVELEEGRKCVPWRPLFDDPDCGVFLIMGQSNAANHGTVRSVSHQEVYSLDFLRMQAYRAEDPLPGASGEGGSPWCMLGDALIEQGLFKRVLFVPIAFGGSFITDWIPDGTLHRRSTLALARLRNELGTPSLNFSAVLWQQGEAEANHTQMAEGTYRQHFYDIVADLRLYGVFCPVFVARATICEDGTHPYQNHTNIRAAQTNLTNPGGGILSGPDTDMIGEADRVSNCHFTGQGLNRCSQLWLEALSARRDVLLEIRPLSTN